MYYISRNILEEKEMMMEFDCTKGQKLVHVLALVLVRDRDLPMIFRSSGALTWKERKGLWALDSTTKRRWNLKN